jgi:RNA polymerase sigma factor (sigma-70 family)
VQSVATGQSNRVVRYLRGLALGQGCAALTDGQLLEHFLGQRDDASFEALLRRHGPMVLGVCRRVLRNEADAADAFQATFLVLVRKAGSIVPRGMVGNWLYGVAHNTARKAKAMNSKRRAREREAGTRPRPEPPAEDWQKLQAVLDDELSRLPEKYRAPIVLCELEGKPIKEAARQLGWAQGTLAGRLSRGRNLLAKRVARHGMTLSGGAVAALAGGTASAGVPGPLVDSTVHAAAAFAAGQAAVAGAVPAQVAALTEGVLKSMLLTKMKIATAVVLVAAALGTGAGEFAYHSQAAQAPATEGGSPYQGQSSYSRTGQQPLSRDDEARLRRALEDLAKQARDLESKAAAIKEDLEALKRKGTANRSYQSGVEPRYLGEKVVVDKKQEADQAVATVMREIHKAMDRLRETTQDRRLESEVLTQIERAVQEMRAKRWGGEGAKPPPVKPPPLKRQ